VQGIQGNHTINKCFLVALSIFLIWLIKCALGSQWTTGDAWQTISNTRFILGDSFFYFSQRGPLITLFFLPAEAVTQWLNLAPLDNSIYQIFAAIFHCGYLLFCWLILIRAYPNHQMSCLIVFLTTIFSITFVSYSNQVSPDILPGIFLFVSIMGFFKWLKTEGIKYLIIMSTSSTLAILAKPSYTAIWISLYSYALVAYCFGNFSQKNTYFIQVSLKSLIKLSVSGFICAIITWFFYATHLSFSPIYHELTFLLKPLVYISKIIGQIPELEREIYFPWSIYLSNLHNYGLGTVFLMAILAKTFFRKDEAILESTQPTNNDNDKQKYFLLFFVLLSCFLLAQITSYREVRYLLYLTPTLAYALVPITNKILLDTQKPLAKVLIIFVAIDIFRNLLGMIDINATKDRMDWISFLQPIYQEFNNEESKVIGTKTYSLMGITDSPLYGDRYHGIEHMSGLILSNLHTNLNVIDRMSSVEVYNSMDIGDAIFYSTFSLTRVADSFPRDVISYDKYVQFSGTVIELPLIKKGENYSFDSQYGMMSILSSKETKYNHEFLLTTKNIAPSTLETLGFLTQHDVLTIKAVKVHGICMAKVRCRTYEPVPSLQIDDGILLQLFTKTPKEEPQELLSIE